MNPITKDEALDELREMLEERRRRFPNLIAKGKIKKHVAERRILALEKALDLLGERSYKWKRDFNQKTLFK